MSDNTSTTISVFAMRDDPRLRKLFALVGEAIHAEDIDGLEDDMYDTMLDLAPEFLPPGDPIYIDEWWQLVQDAR